MYGLCYGGPFGHFFHKLMDKLFPRRDTKTIVSKVSNKFNLRKIDAMLTRKIIALLLFPSL